MLFPRFLLLEGNPGAAGGGAPAQAPASSTSAPPTQAGAKPTGSGPGANDGKTPASAGGTKPAAQTPAQKPELYEVKVSGKTHKLTLEQLTQHASLGFASDQRFQEAAKLKKQAEGLIGKLRDPKSVMIALQDPALGLNKDQIRDTFEEWYAAEFIDAEKLTPAEKELREAKAKLKEYADKDKTTEEEKARAHQESLTTQAREEIQGQIIEALDTGKLPKTNFTIRRLAYWMNRNHANGFNAPTDVLVAQVRQEATTNLRDMVESADGDVLISLLGDGIIQKIRKYDLEELRKLRGGGGQPPSDPPSAPPNGERITSTDVNENLRRMQRTGQY